MYTYMSVGNGEVVVPVCKSDENDMMIKIYNYIKVSILSQWALSLFALVIISS